MLEHIRKNRDDIPDPKVPRSDRTAKSHRPHKSVVQPSVLLLWFKPLIETIGTVGFAIGHSFGFIYNPALLVTTPN
jgi:hypothetical protein